MFSGTWKREKSGPGALNYWLGMDSGVIAVNLSDRLPTGIRTMAQFLQDSIAGKWLDPFARKIVAQDGTVKNDGTTTFTPDQLLHMDWLCDNVIGDIPNPSEDPAHVPGHGGGAGDLRQQAGRRERGSRS